MSSSGVTFNLTCGKGVTELQNLASLSLSSFAESYQMQQKNFDVSPYLMTYLNLGMIIPCFIMIEIGMMLMTLPYQPKREGVVVCILVIN